MGVVMVDDVKKPDASGSLVVEIRQVALRPETAGKGHTSRGDGRIRFVGQRHVDEVAAANLQTGQEIHAGAFRADQGHVQVVCIVDAQSHVHVGQHAGEFFQVDVGHRGAVLLDRLRED